MKSIRAVSRPRSTSAEKRYQSLRRAKPHTNKTKIRNLHQSDHKAAITVGIIMGVFLICWMPFFCVNILAAFCKTCIGDQTFKVLTWLGYSNSAFNPIIYSIFNTEFRQAFKRILTSRYATCCTQEIDMAAYSRKSESFVTDYSVKKVVINTEIFSADLEDVSAI